MVVIKREAFLQWVHRFKKKKIAIFLGGKNFIGSLKVRNGLFLKKKIIKLAYSVDVFENIHVGFCTKK